MIRVGKVCAHAMPQRRVRRLFGVNDAANRFVRRLYEGGFRREHVIEMLRFLDWVMALPEELERRYNQRIEEYE